MNQADAIGMLIIMLVISTPVLIFLFVGFSFHIGEWWRNKEDMLYTEQWIKNSDEVDKDPNYPFRSQKELIEFVEGLVGKPRGLTLSPLGGWEWENGWTIKDRPYPKMFGKGKDGNYLPDEMFKKLPHILKHDRDEAVFDLDSSNMGGYYKLRAKAIDDPQIQVSQKRLHMWAKRERWEFHVAVNYPVNKGSGMANESPVVQNMRSITLGSPELQEHYDRCDEGRAEWWDSQCGIGALRRHIKRSQNG